MELVLTGLAREGYEAVGGQLVDDYLREHRIRYLDSLETRQAAELAEIMEADGIVTGAVLEYGGRTPSVGVAARLTRRDGKQIWTAIAGGGSSSPDAAFPDPAELERQRRRALGAACERLFETFPRPGTTRRYRVRPPTSPRLFSEFLAPRTLEEVRRVCLIPFENFTEARMAPKLVEALFAQRLGQRFETRVVEPADLRRAFIEEGIWFPRLLSAAQLGKVSERLEGCWFLFGDVFSFGEALDARGQAVPVAELSVRLVTPTGRIAWSALHRRTGSEYEHALGLGVLHSRFEVVREVVNEMVQALR
jgi:hypothetical protein